MISGVFIEIFIAESIHLLWCKFSGDKSFGMLLWCFDF